MKKTRSDKQYSLETLSIKSFVTTSKRFADLKGGDQAGNCHTIPTGRGRNQQALMLSTD